MPGSKWFNFLAELEETKTQLGFETNEECFYRGHLQPDWTLSPGLLRNVKPYKSKLITKEVWEVESDLYYEFRSRARVLHNENMSDWDVLFTMQHHKVRTRLLDWTEMIGVAVYFALFDYDASRLKEDCLPCIWLFNPYTFNEHYHGSRDLWDPENLDYYDGSNSSYSELLLGIHGSEGGKMFYWDEPIALYPLRKNDRLTSQGGYFTIHGNNILPIEDLPNKDQFLRQVFLPHEAVEDARRFLGQAGINDFTMFPDLDGLAKYLNSKYFR
jgi:hypothetical protein